MANGGLFIGNPAKSLCGSGTSVPTPTVATFLRVFDEREKNFQFANQVAICLENFLGVFYADLGTVQQFVGFADCANRGGGEVFSLEGNDVNAPRASRESFGEHVGGDILQNARQAADETVAADRSEVVDGNAAAQRGVVFHSHVSAEHDIVGGDHAILDDAVVRDVRVSHEIALASDTGDSRIFFRASIDGHAFTENVAVSNNDLGWRTLIRQILWICANNTTRKETVVAADGRVSSDRHAVFQASPSPDPRVRPNNAMMPDPNVLVEFSSGIDHGGVSDNGWHFSNPLSNRGAGGLYHAARRWRGCKRSCNLISSCAILPFKL